MSRAAIVFPGQGVQKVGMAKDLYHVSKDVTSVLESAQTTVDFDLLETMFTDKKRRLGETENTQPASLTHSIALLEALNRVDAGYTMRHNPGEYSSLVVAGVLKSEDAVKIVRKRSELMTQAFPNGIGSMAAVLGLSCEEVNEVCKEISFGDQLTKPASINAPGQIVVSGHKALIDKLTKEEKTLGARRVIPLVVSGPFHSSIIQVVEGGFASFIDQFTWNDAQFPIIQNYSAHGETKAETIKQNMVKQLYSPVQFTKSTKWLIDQGVDHFIEAGPDKILSGLIKKVNRDVKITPIQILEDVRGWNENN